MKEKKTKITNTSFGQAEFKTEGMGWDNLSCIFIESKFHNERIVVMYHRALNHIESNKENTTGKSKKNVKKSQ